MGALRVAIDGRPLVGHRTGVGQYTAHLIEALSQLDEPPELNIFFGITWSNCFHQLHSGNIPRAWKLARLLRSLTGGLGDRTEQARRWLAHYLQQWSFRYGIRHIRPHVVHGTGSYIYPSHRPTIVTIHDLSCFRHPETHPGFRVRWEHRFIPQVIENANRILAVSEFTKKEICSYFTIDPEKITVAYNGVSPHFRLQAPDNVQDMLHRYNLRRTGYLLTLGTLEPRKNLQTVLRAYQQLPLSVQERHQLVVAGMRGWKELELTESFLELERKGVARILGYVPQEDLPSLYSGAAVFLYPSLYEGFGIPPLESMSVGTPVIVSNTSALPEVVGDAGMLLEPADAEAWSRAIQIVLEDVSLRSEMVARGRARSRHFTWRRCAEATMQAYRAVANA